MFLQDCWEPLGADEPLMLPPQTQGNGDPLTLLPILGETSPALCLQRVSAHQGLIFPPQLREGDFPGWIPCHSESGGHSVVMTLAALCPCPGQSV